MRVPYAYKASFRIGVCSGLTQRCLSRQHRLEKWQSHRDADTAEKCAARNVLLCYEHLSGLLRGCNVLCNNYYISLEFSESRVLSRLKTQNSELKTLIRALFHLRPRLERGAFDDTQYDR